MAVPSFVAASSRSWTQSTTQPTTLPAGLLNGDTLIYITQTFQRTVATPAGWNLRSGPTVNIEGTTVQVQIYIARYDSTGVNGVSAAPTLTWGGSNDWNFYWMGAYRGARADLWMDVRVESQTTASTTPTSGVKNTGYADARSIWFALNNAGSGAITLPAGAGLTSRFTSTGGFAVGDMATPVAGTTVGPLSGSMTTADAWVAGIVHVYPFVTAGAYWGVRSQLAAGGGGGVPAGTTIWKGDGSTALTNQWAEFSNNDQPGGSGTALTSGATSYPTTRLAIDTTFKPSGLDQSIKFQVFDGDNAYGERSEVGQGNPFRNDWDVSNGNNKAGAGNPHMWYQGDDYWIASQIYVPAGFPTPSWQAIHQFKHIDDGDGGPLIIGLSDVGSGPQWEWSSSNSRDYTDSSQTTVQRFSAASSFGRWNQWLVHIKFSDDNTIGFYDVYADIDGAGLVNLVPKTFTYTMCRDESTGILKPSHARIGIYRNPIVSTTSTLWIAGYNVATTKELAAYNAGITLP